MMLTKQKLKPVLYNERGAIACRDCAVRWARNIWGEGYDRRELCNHCLKLRETGKSPWSKHYVKSS